MEQLSTVQGLCIQETLYIVKVSGFYINRLAYFKLAYLMNNRFHTIQARFAGIIPYGLMAIATLLLSACTAIPDQASDQSGEMNTVSEQTLPINKGEQETAKEIAKKSEPVRPKIELTEDILYKILVAEIAGQRDQLNVSVDNYLELARTTRDPELAS
jgi:hypothetical protein